MNFSKFIALDFKNAWIKEPGLDIYIRKCLLPTRCADYELANMTATRPGKGALTVFLDKYEPLYSFYIENVLEQRLVDYFSRRGYVPEKETFDDLSGISMVRRK